MKQPRPWPPRGRYRDERLIFLAAEPELRRIARPWWLVLLGGISFRTVRPAQPGHHRKDMSSTRMVWLVEACDNVGRTLSADELAEVRARGVLPAWFLPAVRGEMKGVRRRHR